MGLLWEKLWHREHKEEAKSLTTEPVTNHQQAQTILRWYTYRWRIEEYHKILKSGCKAESYRLAGDSMQVLLGFLTNIAAQLLKEGRSSRAEGRRSIVRMGI